MNQNIMPSPYIIRPVKMYKFVKMEINSGNVKLESGLKVFIPSLKNNCPKEANTIDIIIMIISSIINCTSLTFTQNLFMDILVYGF